jgi:WD40 repeat protein
MLYFLSLGDRKDSSPSHGHFCRGIACMPGGDALLVGCSDGEVFVICASSHDKIELAQTLRGHTAPVTCAAASSEYAATGDSVGRIIVWDACDHFSRICNITCEGYPVTSMAMRRGLLVVAMGNGVVRMYSAKIGDLCVEVGAHSRCCNAIDIHPNFPIVVTAGEVSSRPPSKRACPSAQRNAFLTELPAG